MRRYNSAGDVLPARTRAEELTALNEANRRKRESKATRPRTSACEVCHGKSASTNRSAVYYDHNHGTDEFRGWLCNKCNSTLGLAGDNPRILRALAAYLEKTGCHPTRPLIR